MALPQIPLFPRAGATKHFSIQGLRGASYAWFAQQICSDVPLCVFVADEEMVAHTAEDLRLFTSKTVLTYPGFEIPPYTPLSPDQQTTAARLSTLYHIQEIGQEVGKDAIVVASIEASMRRVVPKARMTQVAEIIIQGEDTDQQDLVHALVSMGYEQAALVRTVGDFSLRGGILDIYPPPFLTDDGQLHNGPLRLDFFGDTVESLRSFDTLTQRSTGELPEALLLPVTDLLCHPTSPDSIRVFTTAFHTYQEEYGWDDAECRIITDQVRATGRFAGAEFFLPCFFGDKTPATGTFFDYLPKETLLLILDPAECRKTADIVFERIAANFAEAQSAGKPALRPDSLFLCPENLQKSLQDFTSIDLTDFADAADAQERASIQTTNHHLLKQDITAQRKSRGLLPALSERILEWQKADGLVVICCRSARHMKNLAELLTKRGHSLEQVIPPLTENALPKNTTTLYLCDHLLSEGFSLPEQKLHFLSESELFGEMRLGARSKRRRREEDELRFSELNNGDIVVHRDHGLGVYNGIVTLELQGIKNDFMEIEYRDGDKLYLPVDRLNLVSRYEGLSDKTPRIDKLGTQSWKSVTAKVKEEVWKTAQELLDIYAEREIRKGRKFSPPGELYHEFEESFPYDETSGQERAISEVIDDLISEQPMDRLVCGDVGYGKTEVAIRAAFKVVEDDLQVAVLVPTTVLAEQHLKTFTDRLQGFPVTVECINRFRSTTEQKQILARLKEGKIDIIIGTHRLLSKDIVYQNLGLLIVDEEHRFGVAHKEKIKKLKSEVDILTLTATPIPRTLQMSLLGIRDLSVISSPPEHRQPVKTFVAHYDELVIKEAISKEMRRKGQIFFVHNRVKSIHQMAHKVQELVPDARIAIAHGQMDGKELEQIMVRFVNREIDVLIATTIIESGIDIPTANTIIINRADMLGLAEIYQLRGRVGRSTQQAFAYLLVPSLDTLAKDSRERLRALMDYSELGGGFKLAMSDLQIRGGGNLLGVSQSGHIAAIGYDLYLELLQKTVADLKARGNTTDGTGLHDELDPEINLQLSAYIPENYINDIGQRYIAYRRISGLVHQNDTLFQDFRDELEDRYGPLPGEVENLLNVILLKRELAGLRVQKLERGKGTLVFSFLPETPVDPQQLLSYIQKRNKKAKKELSRLLPDGRLVLAIDNTQNPFTVCNMVITDLQAMQPQGAMSTEKESQ